MTWKYRIITNDKRYRVQRRFLWIFWKTIKEFIAYDMLAFVEFDSKKEAQNYIGSLIGADAQRKVYSKRKWKPLK
jgi:hypothetical protein